MTYKLRHDCRLCQSPVRTCVLDLGEVCLANELTASPMYQRRYPLYIVQCDACGHVQCPVVVDPALLFNDYSYTSGTSKSFRKHIEDLVNELDECSTLVDVGSNDGTLVRAADALGIRALGVDPARNLAADASETGALTVPGFFDDAMALAVRKLLGGPVDCVTALNVFAHADNLGDIADGARLLIGKNGRFIFEVAYLLDLLRLNEFGSCYHEHLSHHHVAALEPFLRRHGLRLAEVTRVDAQGGSLRCVCTSDTDDGVPVAVKRMIKEEQEELPALLKAWPDRIRQQVTRDTAQIAPFRKDLAIYGSPARSVTYLAQFDLRPGDVKCVFDDEPRKVGRYTPGTQFQIASSSTLMDVNPKAILILSWNYAEEIKAKFPDYKGQWLLPDRSEA